MIALSTGYMIIYIYIFFFTQTIMALINTNTHNFFSSYHLKHATKQQHDIHHTIFLYEPSLSFN